MARISGRTSVIQIEDSPGSGTFSTIGSLRNNSLTINNRPVDVSNKDTTLGFTAWDTASSIKEVTISGEGIVDDTSTAYDLAKTTSLSADPSAKFRYLEGTGGGTFEGDFVIDSVSQEAPHDGPVTYQIALRNKLDITYTP